MVRVVAGEARGRQLRAPAGRVTRPTTDRVREAIFDMLASATDLTDAVVVDLFAGSGALGIEALSRGAASATFVEADGPAVDTITANLATLGMDRSRATVVRADALRWAAGRSSAPATGADLVMADPPYQFDRWSELLDSLAGWTAMVVLESGAELDVGAEWAPLRVRRYGATVVTIARPANPSAAPFDLKGGM